LVIARASPASYNGAMAIKRNQWVGQSLALGLLATGLLNAADPVRFTVAAEVHPVLIRRDHNPLVEVRVEVPDDGLRLQTLTFSLAGTDDFNDLELVEVFSSASTTVFPPAARFGEPSRAARTVSFSGDHPLSRGLNVFWLSGRLREAAGLTRRVAATCTGLVTTAGEVTADPPVAGRHRRIGVALRRHYDDGVHTHRIPVLATTAKGTLLAAYDLRRREARDLQGDIDIGLSRSTDAGQRWESPRVIMDMGEYGYLQPEENGCSDPGLIVDRQTGEVFCFAVWMHGKPGQHQWAGAGSEPGFEIGRTAQFMMVRSKDDGMTWSPPENLTRQLKPEAWWLLAPSPQQGIQLADGALVMPVQGRDEAGVPFATVMLSSDHGTTWSVGAPACHDASECQAVELGDGSIMLNMRNDRDRHRMVAVTRDRGRTWERLTAAERALIEPNCNASLLRVPHRDGGIERHALVFANPRSTTARTHQTIQVSFDDGRTWPASHHLLLDAGAGFGYPSLTRIDDDHLGIVYEGSQAQLVFEKLSLAELGIPASLRSWAQPAELRGKKLIDAGIYTLDSSPVPLNSRTLAEHPEFTRSHPFDGLAVRVETTIPPDAGPAPPEDPVEAEARGECCLDAFAWARYAVPEAAVAEVVADLKRVAWGSLTDNFLWWNCRGGSEGLKGDISIDADWAAMRSNARLAARLCREAGLKGFLFDTEQYGYYAGTVHPYPFGQGSPELLRQRGRDWIETVQSEFPEVKVMFTFAWSPDLAAAGFLAGVNHFIDGMLDGIAAPGRLIHGYENTFYYGQRDGSRFTETGFPGGRTRYAEARRSMREWRRFSRDPAKFDAFVDVGMAAWLESDPWNLWSGYPSGTRESVWSNLPLALAYADEYVWCWSEHTNYLHSATQPEAGRSGLNPFLASLANQTFNTGREAAGSLREDFATDPLAHGWHFDFDLLESVRWIDPAHAVPGLSTDTAMARWSAVDRALRVGGPSPGGAAGPAVAPAGVQRRRFVHPLRPVTSAEKFTVTIDFQIDAFGGTSGVPMVMGLFHSDSPLARGALALAIEGSEAVNWLLPPGWEMEATRLSAPLRTGVAYRVRFASEAPGLRVRGSLTDLPGTMELATMQARAGGEGAGLGLNELGVARGEVDSATAAAQLPQCRILGMEMARP
jgi:sialidase-1